MIGPCWLTVLSVVATLAAAWRPAHAQVVTHRGFVEIRGFIFPQEAPNDRRRGVVDALGREEAFIKPAPWLQFSAGIDIRANTHDQVHTTWRLDVADRTSRRPSLSIRRLSTTLTRGPLTIDLGKQFIRWGRADIVTPTDRFAPRDYLNVLDDEFFAVRGARVALQLKSGTIDAVWVPVFTPSRLPLLTQRWSTAFPPGVHALVAGDAGASIPDGSQAGVRWSHTTSRYEYSASFFDGFNHLPTLEATAGPSPFDVTIVKRYPALRMYGADAGVPLRWFSLKGEAAYFSSSTPGADEYVLYVLQLERQTGEWQFVGGYAGELVTARRAAYPFAPDRGIARSIVARASYTIDTNRRMAVEGAGRQNGRGLYVKAEYSQARGNHWRTTLAGTFIRGEPDDFLGQYRRNAHVVLGLRYSF